ncbi:phosphotransferase [Streptomyces sp. NPDC047002]|uniref:phosphotransferase n=1 Tax=Streptomyces sp. NPDC047002 TaxID=3155475 RepID=UPI00345643B3
MREVSERPADAWDALLGGIGAGSEPLTGYYHVNFAVALPAALADAVALPAGTVVKLRAPIPHAPQFNLRIWPEGDLLQAIEGRVDGAPRVLARRPGFTVHSFAAGRPLAAAGGAVPFARLGALWRQTAAVPRAALPPLPPAWPADGDCPGFAAALLGFAETEIRGRNGRPFLDLFATLGIPDDAFARLRERAGTVGHRPFVLLHTDVHRGNLIAGPGGALALIDWELALFGDPVYEIATHLSRMGYRTAAERRTAHRAWHAAAGRLAGHRGALAFYRDLEAVQSLYTDVIRGMHTLLCAPDSPSAARAVAVRTHAVLHAARTAAGLTRVPSLERTAAICRDWLRSPTPPTAGPAHRPPHPATDDARSAA